MIKQAVLSESESKIRRRSSGFMLTCVQFPFCLLPLLNTFLSFSYSNCVSSVIILIHTHINFLYILSSSGTWFRGIQREGGWSEADDTRVKGLHIYTHTVVGRCRYSQPKVKDTIQPKRFQPTTFLVRCNTLNDHI